MPERSGPPAVAGHPHLRADAEDQQVIKAIKLYRASRMRGSFFILRTDSKQQKNMKKVLLLILFQAALSFATYVAVLETLSEKKANITRNEKLFLTDKLRERAGVVLPAYLGYTIMTSENIRAMLPPGKAIEECEGSCLVETGRNIAADYVAQARVGKFNKSFSITFELYETASNKRIDGFTGLGNSVDELLALIAKKADAVFQKINKDTHIDSEEDGFSNISTGASYSGSFKNKFILQIETNPSGALISIDGEPKPQCKETPCSVQIEEGEHRISMVREMYQKKDTIILVTNSGTSLTANLIPNFGELTIAPILTDGIGDIKDLSIEVDNTKNSKKIIQLSPGKHSIHIEHPCYEPINFDLNINKGRSLTFDKPLVVALGGLELSAEKKGVPQSLPVFINNQQEGETPFTANVPVCSQIAIGSKNNLIPIKIKYHQNITYIHKIFNSSSTSFEPELSEVSFINDGSNAAANFFEGQQIIEKLEQYNIGGRAREKTKQIEEMENLSKKGTNLYEKASNNDKWYFPAILQSGRLLITIADRIQKQELSSKREEEKFAERIKIAQELIPYYEVAMAFFQKAISQARTKGITNEYVKAIEEYYINMFLKNCNIYHQIQTAFSTSPLPDSALVVREYIGQGMVKDDAITATHADLEAYREELNNRAEAAKELAIRHCSDGLKAATKYAIKNDQVEAIKDLIHNLKK